jgi:glycosyltransferase involved in cell wall biosynthesis
VEAMIFDCVAVEEMAFLYQHAALLCFPSLFEGFGIPLVEAMAAGCPVACAATSSSPEIAGDAAVLFDPSRPRDCASAIHATYSDAALRLRLISAGLERAAMFASARMAAEHLSTFQQAATQFSRLRFLKNKLVFNPLHNRRLLRRRPPAEH